MDLTAEGQGHRAQVVSVLFAYLRLLRARVSPYLVLELEKRTKMAYEFAGDLLCPNLELT